MGATSTGKIIAIALTGLFLTALSSGLITASQTSPLDPKLKGNTTAEPDGVVNAGTVATNNVGVYTDAECTQNCTSLDWGTLSPGAETTKDVYVKNFGIVPKRLSITTANWNPLDAIAYLNLTWDRADHVLGANGVVPAKLTLTVSPAVANITDFTFDIIITGSD